MKELYRNEIEREARYTVTEWRCYQLLGHEMIVM